MKPFDKNKYIGKEYNWLTVVSFSQDRMSAENPKYVRQIVRYVNVVCRCGNTKTLNLSNLVMGKSKSCGCRPHKTKYSHVKDKSLYSTWYSMIDRCNNPEVKEYKNYGGRGITVCDRWKNSFENFVSDVGNKPTPKHSLDRINNNGNYEPSNCRWANRKEQNNNTRISPMLTSAKVALRTNLSSERIRQLCNNGVLDDHIESRFCGHIIFKESVIDFIKCNKHTKYPKMAERYTVAKYKNNLYLS